MTEYIKYRILSLLPVAVGISFITFALAYLAPGDPAELILERAGSTVATEADMIKFRDELGIDKPFIVQYFLWLKGLLYGNLGISFQTGQTVVEEIRRHLPYTLMVAVPAIFCTFISSLVYGFLLNCYIGTGKGKVLSLVGKICISLPGFLVSMLLIYLFSEVLGLLPSSGLNDLSSLILPSIALSLISSAMMGQVLNRQLIQEMDKYYCAVARLRGLTRKRIILEYALPNAFMPVVAMLGNYAGAILGGSVVVEYIFAVPGLGSMALDAIHFRDYPLLQGYVLFTGIVYVTVTALVDIILYGINPKMYLNDR